MNQIKTENWNGYKIRFVEKELGEWWAVLKDVTDALELKTWKVTQRIKDDLLSKYTVKDGLNRDQEVVIINEKGIYETVFGSRKKEAMEFKDWVYDMLIELRKNSNLEGFQIFRMMDKEFYKETINKIKGMKNPTREQYIKANTISNKAVSNMNHIPKMIKKDDMTPEMLTQRQAVLDDTVNLMVIVDKFNLGCSISEKIYERYH